MTPQASSLASASGSQLPSAHTGQSAAISEAPRPQAYLQSQMGTWMVWGRSLLLRTAGQEGGFLHGVQGSELPAGHCLQTPLVQLQPPLCQSPCTPARRDPRVSTDHVFYPHSHVDNICFCQLDTARTTLLPGYLYVIKECSTHQDM